jgi:hypothetical protein
MIQPIRDSILRTNPPRHGAKWREASASKLNTCKLSDLPLPRLGLEHALAIVKSSKDRG